MATGESGFGSRPWVQQSNPDGTGVEADPAADPTIGGLVDHAEWMVSSGQAKFSVERYLGLMRYTDLAHRQAVFAEYERRLAERAKDPGEAEPDPDPLDEPYDRTLAFAKLLMAAYDDLIGEARRDWDATDGTVSDETRRKYLMAAADALDTLEWTKFGLAPVEGSA